MTFTRIARIILLVGGLIGSFQAYAAGSNETNIVSCRSFFSQFFEGFFSQVKREPQYSDFVQVRQLLITAGMKPERVNALLTFIDAFIVIGTRLRLGRLETPLES